MNREYSTTSRDRAIMNIRRLTRNSTQPSQSVYVQESAEQNVSLPRQSDFLLIQNCGQSFGPSNTAPKQSSAHLLCRIGYSGAVQSNNESQPLQSQRRLSDEPVHMREPVVLQQYVASAPAAEHMQSNPANNSDILGCSFRNPWFCSLVVEFIILGPLLFLSYLGGLPRKVRTKDRMFESVSHLINFHCQNQLPIISAESALILQNPVPRTAL